jgi:hypothetical protein
LGVDGDVTRIYREEALSDDMLDRYGRLPIFAPGFSVARNAYPYFYKLTDMEKLPETLIPFGCGWQHPIGFPEHAEVAKFQGPTERLLHNIARTTGRLAVRDHIAYTVLANNRIPVVMVGDCAWYDLDSHKRAMKRVTKLRKVIVTTPHSRELLGQSLSLIRSISERFPGVEITVSFHSKLNSHDFKIEEEVTKQGHNVIHAAGDISVFDRYQEFDLHIGHRLHGHIGFLRKRIPSVLLIEDARGRGFSYSIPVGCFSARTSALGNHLFTQLSKVSAHQQLRVDDKVVERVLGFVGQELESGFARYVGVAQYLDSMLEEVFLPELKRKVELTCVKSAKE